MQLTFYTPSYKEAKDFGCASFGFAGAQEPTDTLAKTVPHDLKGVMLCGSYADILQNLPEGNFQAGIVLLGNKGGENEFVRTLAQKTNAPLVGGSAAICPQTGESALITGHGDAAVFLISDARFDVEVISENIHYDILSEHTLTFTGRYIDTIDGADALMWYNQKRNARSLPKADFEHLTLSDTKGINAHLSMRDGKLYCGRDPEEKMVFRFLPPEKAQERIQAFYDDEDAIVFGCAGLKQTLTAPLKDSPFGLFMFGEVCTVNGHSDFGNLMLSKLVIRKKSN